jgi:hypothetical protein
MTVLASLPGRSGSRITASNGSVAVGGSLKISEVAIKTTRDTPAEAKAKALSYVRIAQAQCSTMSRWSKIFNGQDRDELVDLNQLAAMPMFGAPEDLAIVLDQSVMADIKAHAMKILTAQGPIQVLMITNIGRYAPGTPESFGLDEQSAREFSEAKSKTIAATRDFCTYLKVLGSKLN